MLKIVLTRLVYDLLVYE